MEGHSEAALGLRVGGEHFREWGANMKAWFNDYVFKVCLFAFLPPSNAQQCRQTDRQTHRRTDGQTDRDDVAVTVHWITLKA